VERRWCCVQHFPFSCKACPPDCPDPTDLWLDFLIRLSANAVAAARVHQAMHVDSFDPADVPCSCHGFCIPSASCQLVHAMFPLLCARFLPAMSFWLGPLLLLRQCLLVNVCLLMVTCTCALRPVLLGVAPPSFRPFGGAEAEALLV
jgi:hypothetical protein